MQFKDLAGGKVRDVTTKNSFIRLLRVAYKSLKKMETHLIFYARVKLIVYDVIAMPLRCRPDLGTMLWTLIYFLQKRGEAK